MYIKVTEVKSSPSGFYTADAWISFGHIQKISKTDQVVGNRNHPEFIRKGEYTHINLFGGKDLDVCETPEEIMALISDAVEKDPRSAGMTPVQESPGNSKPNPGSGDYLGLAGIAHHDSEATRKYNFLLNLIGTEGMLIEFERFMDAQDLRDIIVQVTERLTHDA